jgi:hypothetical protein
MRILILGSTGPTGLLLVREALAIYNDSGSTLVLLDLHRL